jgi:peptidoglycan hydrolase-like protein with peptidoglycan-binding domain
MSRDEITQDRALDTDNGGVEWTRAFGSRRRAWLGAAVVLVLVAALLMISAPAAAAATISYGDPVDYDLEFAVDGPTEFKDTFGACRDGCSRGHEGIDIFATKGTPVVASANGTVRYVNWSRSQGLNPARCCSVVIDHDDGWQSRYLHLNNDSKGTDDGKGWGVADGITPGARVKSGQLIGWVGDSGNAESTASHLHFELLAPGGIVTNAYRALLLARQNTIDAADALFASAVTIRKGDRGDAVERLQEVLNELGYKAGATDGIFGNKTLQATVAFQEDRGLVDDGLVGKKTKASLQEAIRPKPTLRRGDRNDDVAYLQEALHGRGFDSGAPDGIFGRNTETAVKSFQDSAGLKVDGIVGKNTWAALRGA